MYMITMYILCIFWLDVDGFVMIHMDPLHFATSRISHYDPYMYDVILDSLDHNSLKGVWTS